MSSTSSSSIPPPISTEENYISFYKCPTNLNFIPGKSNIVFLNIGDKTEKQESEVEEKNEEPIDIRTRQEHIPSKIVESSSGSVASSSKPVPLRSSVDTTPQGPPKAYDNFYPSTFRLRNITIYETRSRYYLVGANSSKTKFRVLKLDRRAQEDDLAMDVDSTEYNIHEINRLLLMIKEGNHGGLKEIGTGKGIMGFIRFTHGYHLIYITKKRKVGTISCHKIYAVDGVSYLYLPKSSEGKDQLESRYKSLFFAMQMTDFYFSYTYDLTHTLQHNMASSLPPQYDKRFVWNHYLLKKLVEQNGNNSVWVLPLIHGYVGQRTISIFGKLFKITIIARRSRHFAGTRFLKRGVNSQGRVANDVETEQIIEDCSFPSLNNSKNLSSYVQIRGSIPLFWGQEAKSLIPKPPVYVQRCDPFYAATKLHFQDLLRRFGRPTVVLNLIKEKEKKPRESIIRKEFHSAIEQINGPLPIELKIHHLAWDFSRASKSDASEVITELTNIAESSIINTGYFQSGSQLYSNFIHRNALFDSPDHSTPNSYYLITSTNSNYIISNPNNTYLIPFIDKNNQIVNVNVVINTLSSGNLSSSPSSSSLIPPSHSHDDILSSSSSSSTNDQKTKWKRMKNSTTTSFTSTSQIINNNSGSVGNINTLSGSGSSYFGSESIIPTTPLLKENILNSKHYNLKSSKSAHLKSTNHHHHPLLLSTHNSINNIHQSGVQHGSTNNITTLSSNSSHLISSNYYSNYLNNPANNLKNNYSSPPSPSSSNTTIINNNNSSSVMNGNGNGSNNWRSANSLHFLPPIPFEGKLQNGVLRSNCIDSLDRTNAAQFVAGKVAFGYQVYSLGLMSTPELDIDDELIDYLMDLYQEMGNALALQYGGSHLAHTMGTYKGNTKTLSTQSRDMIASLQRYYSNSFNDKAKQDSINLFLGNFKPFQENTNLWDLETDYYLHMKDPSSSESSMLSNTWCEEALIEFYMKHNRSECPSLSEIKSSIFINHRRNANIQPQPSSSSHSSSSSPSSPSSSSSTPNHDTQNKRLSASAASLLNQSSSNLGFNNADYHHHHHHSLSSQLDDSHHHHHHHSNSSNSSNNYKSIDFDDQHNQHNHHHHHNGGGGEEEWNYDSLMNINFSELTTEEAEIIELHGNYFAEFYCTNRITSFDKIFKHLHSRPLPLDSSRRSAPPSSMNAASAKMKRWITLRNNINAWKNKRTKKHQIRDWDPYTEPHPDYYLTRHLLFVHGSLLGPLFNSLALFNLSFDVMNIDRALYFEMVGLMKDRSLFLSSVFDMYEERAKRSSSSTDLRHYTYSDLNDDDNNDTNDILRPPSFPITPILQSLSSLTPDSSSSSSSTYASSHQNNAIYSSISQSKSTLTSSVASSQTPSSSSSTILNATSSIKNMSSITPTSSKQQPPSAAQRRASPVAAKSSPPPSSSSSSSLSSSSSPFNPSIKNINSAIQSSNSSLNTTTMTTNNTSSIRNFSATATNGQPPPPSSSSSSSSSSQYTNADYRHDNNNNLTAENNNHHHHHHHHSSSTTATSTTRKRYNKLHPSILSFNLRTQKQFYENVIQSATDLSFISSSSYYPSSQSQSKADAPKKYLDYVQFYANAPSSFQEIEVNPRDLNSYISAVNYM